MQLPGTAVLVLITLLRSVRLSSTAVLEFVNSPVLCVVAWYSCVRVCHKPWTLCGCQVQLFQSLIVMSPVLCAVAQYSCVRVCQQSCALCGCPVQLY